MPVTSKKKKKSEIYMNIFSGSRKQDSVKCKGKEEEKES